MVQALKSTKLEKLVFQDFLLNFPGHLFWKDLSGTYLGCNQLQAIDFGFSSPEAVVGKTDLDLQSSLKMAELVRLNDLKVMQTGVVLTGEEGGYLSTKAPLRDEAGKIIGVLGIAICSENYKKTILDNDMTFEKLIAAMPGHVYWKDKNSRLLGCNDGQAFDAGLASRHEIVGKSSYDLLYQNQPEYEKRIQAGITDAIDRRVMNSGEMNTMEEFVVAPDNSRVEYLSKKVPLRNDQDEVVGLLGVSFDITSMKQKERALMEEAKQAAVTNQLKSEFIFNLRHDLVTPFSGILGMADLMACDETDVAKKENLTQIKESAKSLLNQLDKIFDYFHLENAALPVKEKLFDARKLSDELSTMMQPAAKTKGLQLTVSFDPSIPKGLIGDELRTSRILINLLSNALKYTKSGEVKLETKLAKQSGRRAILSFVVTDTGVGIPPEKQELLFEKVDHAFAPELFLSKGLGFRIIKKFVNELEGDIYLESHPGQGSAITILVPYKLPLLAGDAHG